MAYFRITFLLVIFTLHQQLQTISAEEAKDLLLYPGAARSEHELQSCGEREVCSIVHKRFFYPKSVERFCRCADKECPSNWIDTPDNFTMYTNNRAQMKFCEPITDLPNCVDNNETTPLYLTITNTTSKVQLDNEPIEHIKDYKITSKASCHCPQHHKWICSSLETNSNTETTVMQYRCASADGTDKHPNTSLGRCTRVQQINKNSVIRNCHSTGSFLLVEFYLSVVLTMSRRPKR